MREMLICPRCGTTYSVEEYVPGLACEECRAKLVKMDVSKEVWDGYSEEQKAEVKAAVLRGDPAGRSLQEQLLDAVKDIRHDLHFIYVLVVLELVLGVVAGLLLLLGR